MFEPQTGARTGMVHSSARTHDRGIISTILAIIIGLIGLWLTGLGGYLAALGGSLYYVFAGVALLATSFLLWRRKSAALVVYAALLVVTIIWAIAEVHLDFWQLAPRGDLLVPIGVLLIFPWVTRRLTPRVTLRSEAGLSMAVALVFSLAVLVLALTRDMHDRPGALPSRHAASVYYAAANGDWPAYAGTWAGLKYSPLAQVTPGNVAKLDVAWHVHTGDLKRPSDPGEFTYEMTPIKIGDLLYLCTPHDIVIALDPVTGKSKWRFDPHVTVKGTQHMSCRGVSYYDPAAAPGAPPMPPRAPDCSTRIFLATNDARLIALDAASGRPCSDFGTGGQINLTRNLRIRDRDSYEVTSPPTVIGDTVVVGSSIGDNRAIDVERGVIRAFDARTGAQRWAFDP